MELDSEKLFPLSIYLIMKVLILVLMELDSESYLRKKPITAGFIAISHFTFLYVKYPKFTHIQKK